MLFELLLEELSHYIMKSGTSEKPRVSWTSHPTQLLKGRNYLLLNSSVPEILDQRICQTVSQKAEFSSQKNSPRQAVGEPCLEIST